jgi:hypothetical protein
MAGPIEEYVKNMGIEYKITVIFKLCSFCPEIFLIDYLHNNFFVYLLNAKEVCYTILSSYRLYNCIGT